MCYAVDGISGMVVTLVYIEERIDANQYRVMPADHLYPVMNYFCPDGSKILD